MPASAQGVAFVAAQARRSNAPTHAAMKPTSETLQLPDGRTFDLERKRWDGPLDQAEVAFCRARGIPLAFDCAQSGWVLEQSGDASLPSAAAANATAAGVSGGALPLADAIQLARSWMQQRLRVASEDGSTASRRELAAAADGQVESIGRQHGVRAANAAHWALRSELARALPVAVEMDPGGADSFTFRPWTADDAEVYRELLDNPSVWQFLPEPYPGELSVGMARTLIALGAADGQLAHAVVRDGQPVGQCLLRRYETDAGVRCAEVAYWLGEQHWGKGWMGRVLPAFLAAAMRRDKLDVVYAWIRGDHDASRRVALRSGMARDSFPFERELASALNKPGCERYVVYRADCAEVQS